MQDQFGNTIQTIESVLSKTVYFKTHAFSCLRGIASTSYLSSYLRSITLNSSRPVQVVDLVKKQLVNIDVFYFFAFKEVSY
jgi:hypothetical protein